MRAHTACETQKGTVWQTQLLMRSITCGIRSEADRRSEDQWYYENHETNDDAFALGQFTARGRRQVDCHERGTTTGEREQEPA